MLLKLVDKFSEVDPSVVTFVWEPERPIRWTAGQFLKYNLPHAQADDRGITRWFTIAAPPFEGKPRITTRFASENGSTFKTALHAFEPGATIEVAGPMGGFTFDQSRPAVLVAGGIGITPYRAMLLQLDHDHMSFQAHLLYANRIGRYVFRDQFEKIAAKSSTFKVSYFTEPTRIEVADITRAGGGFSKPLYYLSGPEPMVGHFEDLLKQAGVTEDDIRTDYFPGYN